MKDRAKLEQRHTHKYDDRNHRGRSKVVIPLTEWRDLEIGQEKIGDKVPTKTQTNVAAKIQGWLRAERQKAIWFYADVSCLLIWFRNVCKRERVERCDNVKMKNRNRPDKQNRIILKSEAHMSQLTHSLKMSLCLTSLMFSHTHTHTHSYTQK